MRFKNKNLLRHDKKCAHFFFLPPLPQPQGNWEFIKKNNSIPDKKCALFYFRKKKFLHNSFAKIQLRHVWQILKIQVGGVGEGKKSVHTSCRTSMWIFF